MVPPCEIQVDLVVHLTHHQRLNILALGLNMKGSIMDLRKANQLLSKHLNQDMQPPMLQDPYKDKDHMMATSQRSINHHLSRAMGSPAQDPVMASNLHQEATQSTRNHHVNTFLELPIQMLSLCVMLTEALLVVFQCHRVISQEVMYILHLGQRQFILLQTVEILTPSIHRNLQALLASTLNSQRINFTVVVRTMISKFSLILLRKRVSSNLSATAAPVTQYDTPMDYQDSRPQYQDPNAFSQASSMPSAYSQAPISSGYSTASAASIAAPINPTVNAGVPSSRRSDRDDRRRDDRDSRHHRRP